ncbi:aldehyde ferredoxin oxidoreductase N-terminal domain-containing protein [Thermodesulfobacteriota bacterium]
MAELKYGYVGKILRVDLTTKKTSIVPTSNYAPKFIGGRSIAAKIYWDEVPPEVGALSPENRIIFMTGPLVGTLAPGGTNRVIVVSKSPEPVPENYCWSVIGGHWGPELKFAGYDGVIVQGRSPEPVYLWIHDGDAEIREAGYLWGKVTSVVEEELNRLHGLQIKTMIIGPAGENLVKPSVIEADGHCAAGLGSFGAVMGSKKLKAIAVRGTGSVKVARPQELIDIYQYWTGMGEVASSLSKRGTGIFYNRKTPEGRPNRLQDLVARGEATHKAGGCWTCNVCHLCGMRFKNLAAPNGTCQCNDFAELQQEEYLLTGTWMTEDGWEFGILCDDLGISTTQVIGHTIPFQEEYHGGTWAWELVTAGLWTEENTGLPVGTKEKPNVGSREFNRALLHKIAYREGIGDLLAEGPRSYLKHVYETAPSELKEAAKEQYDKNIYKEEYHVCWQAGKIIERGYAHWINVALDARNNRLYSWIGRGASFLPTKASIEEQKALAKKLFGDERAHDCYTPEVKAPVTVLGQDLNIEADSLTLCASNTGGVAYTDTEKLMSIGARSFSAVTGIDRTFDEMRKEVGERTFTLERAIQVANGRRRNHDIYNDFYFTKAKWPWNPEGRLASEWVTKDLHWKVMEEYYALRGWDIATGIPTRKKLEELGMKDVADDLKSKYGVTVPA